MWNGGGSGRFVRGGGTGVMGGAGVVDRGRMMSSTGMMGRGVMMSSARVMG